MVRWGSLEIATTIDELVNRADSALIMWDYAQGLVDRAFNRETFVKSSAKLLQGARECGVPVFFACQSDMTWEDVGPGLIRMRIRNMDQARVDSSRSVNRPGTPQAQIVEEVAPVDGDIIFEKFLPSAFLGTNLDWRLRARGIKTLVLAGISLETGVDGTAREASNRGYYSVIARDSVSSGSEKRFKLSMALCEELHDVFDSDEIIASWKKKVRS